MNSIVLRNGKTLTEALKIIARDKKPTKLLQDKYPYFKYAEYIERFDEAFGADGYEPMYSNFNVYTLPTPDANNETVSQVLVKTDCVISIIGENGEVVLKVSGVGTKELGRNKDMVAYIGINNCGLFAQQAAFKSAAKSLNIFNACFDEDGDDGKGKGSKSSSNAGATGGGKNESAASGAKTTTKITFYVNKEIEKIRDDAQTGKPVYRMIAHEMIDNKCREAECEVILYPNCYKNVINQVNNLISGNLPRKITMNVSNVAGQSSGIYEKSFVFKSFAGGK